MFIPVTLQLLAGFWESIKVFLMTLLFSIPLGLVICFGSMSNFRPLKWLTRTFVWVIRGTPLMLQLIIIFYGPGLILDMPAPMSRFTATIVAFAINYACYFSEIYRGGIESISKGQYEAGYVLGLTKSQIFRKIILIAKNMGAEGLIWPLFYTGAFYLLFVGLLTIILGKVEKKLSYFRS